MLKVIKHLLERNAFVIAITITILIVLLSLLQINTYVPDFNLSFQDKIGHTFAYFILTFSWFLTFNKYQKQAQIKTLIIFMVLLFGIIIEVLQESITSYRTFDYYDILANTIGALIAFLAFNLYYKVSYKEKNL